MNRIKFDVRFYETDMMGLVHHSNHIRWFEFGRVEYFRKAGIDLNELMDEGIMSPILNVACNYKEAAHFDDSLILETTLEAVTRVRLTFSYRIIREKDGAVLATGTTESVFADTHTGKARRLPMHRYEALKELALQEEG